MPVHDGFPTVQGRCPACGGTGLFLGSGGYVTCPRLDCPNPSAANDLLHQRPHDWATRKTANPCCGARIGHYPGCPTNRPHRTV